MRVDESFWVNLFSSWLTSLQPHWLFAIPKIYQANSHFDTCAPVFPSSWNACSPNVYLANSVFDISLCSKLTFWMWSHCSTWSFDLSLSSSVPKLWNPLLILPDFYYFHNTYYLLTLYLLKMSILSFCP